jgi:hypothetical protein
LGVGAVLVFLGVTGDRLESLKIGDLEFALRRRANEAARRGDVETAEALQRAADTISQRVARVAGTYKSVRGTMAAGPGRTIEMDKIIKQSGEDAHAPGVDQEEVLSRLWTGSEGARVWALGVLQERPELATTRAILEAIQRPDAPFDRFYALTLAESFIRLQREMWPCERVRNLVQGQLDRNAYGEDKHSIVAAEQLLSAIDNHLRKIRTQRQQERG